MAYRIALRQPIEAECRRIALEQIDRVIGRLTAKAENETAIHESRKGLKRLRALLRLVRPGLGEDRFARHNTALRDTGQLLSGDRDRQVLSELAAKLAPTLPGKAGSALTRIARELAVPTVNGQDGAAAATAAARLTELREDLARLQLTPDSFAMVLRGLARSYRCGRRRLRRAYAEPTDEGFHDLRKSVQQQWRHMQLLSRAWPDLFAARVEAARRLSQILGDDHDLAVLRAHLEDASPSPLSAAERAAIARHCQRRQDALRTRAEPLCVQLFAERPGRFAKRIAVLWRAAEIAAERDEAAKAAAERQATARSKPASRAASGRSAAKSAAKSRGKSRTTARASKASPRPARS